LNLLRAGVKNVIAMNGTKLPDSIKKLSEEKEIILFVDGDRGGKLIIQNVTDNARIKYISVAPDGKEVEELTGKEIFMCLRKKIPKEEFLSRSGYPKRSHEREERSEKLSLDEKSKKRLKEISEKNKGKGKAILLDNSLEEIKSVPARSLAITLKKMREKPSFVIIDGTATASAIKTAEEAGVKTLVAKNFTTTDTKIELLSF